MWTYSKKVVKGSDKVWILADTFKKISGYYPLPKAPPFVTMYDIGMGIKR